MTLPRLEVYILGIISASTYLKINKIKISIIKFWEMRFQNSIITVKMVRQDKYLQSTNHDCT